VQLLIQLFVLVLILPVQDPVEWLADALAGRPQGIRGLVQALLPIVRARVRRVLARNPAGAPCLAQDVDDVVQETFGVLFAEDARLLRRYDPERGMSLANYVGQIAEREAGRLLRARGAAKRRGEILATPMEDVLQRAPDGGEGTVALLEKRERMEMLLARLREELTDESFLVFELLYVRLLSAPEAASMLGCEVQAVYTRKSRIRTRVRALLVELEQSSWDG